MSHLVISSQLRFGAALISFRKRNNTVEVSQQHRFGSVMVILVDTRRVAGFDSKEVWVNVDLFLKKVPAVVKDLISREASENRRSINQEAIALLEEALMSRVAAQRSQRRASLVETLRTYADSGSGELDGTLTIKPVPSVGRDTH